MDQRFGVGFWPGGEAGGVLGLAGLDGGVAGRGEVVGLGVEVGFPGAGVLPGVGVGLLGLFMFVLSSLWRRPEPTGWHRPRYGNERAGIVRKAPRDATSSWITRP